MALKTQEKKIIIDSIHKITKQSISVITADTRFVNSNEITELRKQARKKGVIVKVIRNTLLNIAVQNTNFECLKNVISGPVFIAYSIDHPGTAARLFVKFAKKNNNFKITNAVFDKKLLSPIQIIQLSELPTYKESIIRLLFVIRDASAGKLVRLLNSLIQKKIT